MTKDKWIWMPHAGHFICSKDCRFHLNTYVGKYIVSTVGEMWGDRIVREIHAKVYDPRWLSENAHRKGSDFDYAYMKKFGYQEIGCGRTYETMVFKAKQNKEHGCCPYIMANTNHLDINVYNTAKEAYEGHLKLCKKWARNQSHGKEER